MADDLGSKNQFASQERADQVDVNAENIKTEVFIDLDRLATLQPEWDEFVESVGSEIFLTYDWCRIWWKYYGKNRELRVFVFRTSEELVGIIPLFFERIWLGPVFVRAAKIVGSDFTGSQFSLPVSNKYIKPVLQKFFDLLSGDNWDVMHIGPIAGLYQYYDDLKSTCEQLLSYRYLVQNESKGVQTYFRLQDDWESQLANIKQNERGNIRRNYNAIGRKCSAASFQLEARFATEDNFDEYFDDFVRMHQLHWNVLGKAGHFKDWPLAYEYHRDIARNQLRAGRLRLLKVSLGNDCFGYQYHYRFGEKYFHLLDSRPEQSPLANVSPGRITFCEQIKKALVEGTQCIDSLRGKYDHKLRLGGKLFPIRNLYFIPKKPTTVIRVKMFRLFARFLNMFYYRIWYIRIAPKLPLKQNGLRKIWIRTHVFS